MDTDQRASHSFAPHLALIAVQILFGTWPIVGKVVLQSISTSSLVALRLTGAAVAFSLLQRKFASLPRMSSKNFWLLALCSALGVVSNQFLYVKGLSLSTVINVTLLSTTIPVFALLVSILAGYDQLSLRRLIGIVLAAGGVVYLVNPVRADLSADTTAGNLLIVINSLLYAIYIVISKTLLERYGALNVVTWIFLLASIEAVPMGIYSLQEEDLGAISAGVWLMIVYIIIFPTVAAYYLNAWALAKVPPSTVAIYIYLQPLIAFGFAPLLLGEQWNSRTIIAALLIFAGVAVVTKRGRSRAIKEISEHPDALAR